MAKCPNCSHWVKPNFYGKNTIKCKNCSALLAENDKNSYITRLGFLGTMLFLPFFLFMFLTESINLVFIIVFPLSIFIFNSLTKYEIQNMEEVKKKNAVPPFK